MTPNSAHPAAASGTFSIGGDLTVNRLGYGTMRLTGDGVWGEPADRDEAIRVLRRAVELGVTFVDTADAYGPFVAEELIRDALHPYPQDLVIATKAGFTRGGPNIWRECGRPEYLRQQVLLSLRHLRVDTIDLHQLHRIDKSVPLADQVGELAKLQQEGKIRHIGLSEVTVDQLGEAQRSATIVSVQNRYNVGDRRAEPLLQHCEEHDIAFIPWYPLAAGKLREGEAMQKIAHQLHATPNQLALAWLLHRSPVLLPIPGTSKVAHLEANVKAATIQLSGEDAAAIEEGAGALAVA